MPKTVPTEASVPDYLAAIPDAVDELTPTPSAS